MGEVRTRVAKAIALKMLRDWDDPKTQRPLYLMQADAALAELSVIFSEDHSKEPFS